MIMFSGLLNDRKHGNRYTLPVNGNFPEAMPPDGLPDPFTGRKRNSTTIKRQTGFTVPLAGRKEVPGKPTRITRFNSFFLLRNS
jgi:hypothetical protein